ncbi:MAG: sugar ABC transporter permease [Clostridia bacterium]|nr:sugar ABC transporter permease [Clostridia bacterium]MDY2901092.1 sugar ABC transporter permease [Christensenellaceae bacterium]
MGKNDSKVEIIMKKFRLTQKKRIEWLFAGSLLLIPIIHFCVFNLYVNLNAVLLSFKTYKADIDSYVWNFGDFFINYKDMFKAFTVEGSGLLLSCRNSLVFTILNNFFLLPLSVILTYFLHKKMPCTLFFRVIFQLPSIISVVVLVMVFRFMFDSTIGFVNPFLKWIGLEKIIPKEGWLGTEKTAWILMITYCVWVGFGGNVLLLSGAMARVPSELIEAAKIDGIGFWSELWHIEVPLIGGTISTMLLLSVQVFFSYFLPVQLLTNGGPDGATQTLAMYSIRFIKGGGTDLTQSATLGMIITLIGTPLIIGFKKLFDKVFPAYEF